MGLRWLGRWAYHDSDDGVVVGIVDVVRQFFDNLKHVYNEFILD